MRPMGTAAYRGKGQGKGKGRGEGRLGQGGRGRSKGGEKPMGTTAYGGKGSKGRAANGDRPVGAASCRRDHHTMASCQNPRVVTASHAHVLCSSTLMPCYRCPCCLPCLAVPLFPVRCTLPCPFWCGSRVLFGCVAPPPFRWRSWVAPVRSCSCPICLSPAQGFRVSARR